MSGGRSWIGKQRELGRRTDEFKQGVIDFLNFAYSHQECVTNGKIRCPCGRCRLNLLQERHVVKVHLSRDEFMPDYTIWHQHGERAPAGVGPTEVLQPPQIEVLQPPQIEVLQPPQIEVLQPPQIEVLQPPQIEVLQPPQIEVLQPPQIEVLQPTQIEVLQPPQIEVLQAPQIEVLQPTRDLEIQIEEGASKRKDFADVYDKTRGCSKTTAPIVQRRVASKGKDFADVYDKTRRYSKTTAPIVQRRVASKSKDFADVYDKTLCKRCTCSKTTAPRLRLGPTRGVKKGKSVLSRNFWIAVKKFLAHEASSKGLFASQPSAKKPYVSQASSGSTNMKKRFMELQSELQTRLGSIDGRLDSTDGRLGSIQGRLESLQNQMRELFDILSAQCHRGSSSSDSTSLDDA